MVKKYIQIKSPEGDVFYISARIIAEHRANYYSTIDGYEIGSNEWQNEVNYALNSEYEIEDWLNENISWEEIKPYIKK